VRPLALGGILSAALVLAFVDVGCGASVSEVNGSDGGVPEGSADGSVDGASGRDGGTTADSSTGRDAGEVVDIRCGGGSATFSSDVSPIFWESCAGEMCHGGLATGPFPYEQLVNVQSSRNACSPKRTLVTPGKPGESYILNKLTGKGMCGDTRIMPSAEGQLPPAKIQLITDWICAGAKKD
jgi:hypothetical protein